MGIFNASARKDSFLFVPIVATMSSHHEYPASLAQNQSVLELLWTFGMFDLGSDLFKSACKSFHFPHQFLPVLMLINIKNNMIIILQGKS